MSLVDIWPSTVIRSNERGDGGAQPASGSAISASVCTKQSMVANPGCIIPAPFAWAETVTPPARTVHAFGPRSVVMIDAANSPAPSAESAPAASPMPRDDVVDQQRHPDHPGLGDGDGPRLDPDRRAPRRHASRARRRSPARRWRRWRCRS